MKTEDGSGILQNIKKVSAGATHTIVLSDDGIAYATGYNGYGQLGIGDTTTKILPTKMIDTEGNVVTRIKDIEANGYFYAYFFGFRRTVLERFGILNV